MKVRCTWCDLLPEPLMPEGVQSVSRSYIVEDHQCSLSLSCTCHIVCWSWICMQHIRLLTERVVRLVFLERSSNPMEARCCIARKECMQKEDVLAYVWSKPLLHSLGVPLLCEAVLCSSLDQGKRRGRSILSLHGKGNQKVYVITYTHSVAGRSRLHGLLYNKEASISRSMVRLAALLRQLFTQHDN